MFVTSCATIAFILIEASLPLLNSIVGKQIEIDYANNLPFVAMMLGLALLTGIVAGSYPAFFLSARHALLQHPNLLAMTVTEQVPAKAGNGAGYIVAGLEPDGHTRFFVDHDFLKTYGIGIACLGLFGLAAFTAERRTKEIGVRKVLGATVTNVVTLLSKDFVKLVLLANIIAWPLAWFAMNKWLQSFTFRVEMEWWVFALAGGMALLIALITVSTLAIKAALANPVEALRYE